jgi:hypothetical protein
MIRNARLFVGDYGMSFRLYLSDVILRDESDRPRSFARSAEMVEVPDGEEPPALASLGRDAAQRLLDDLIHAGLRPSVPFEGDSATRRHLEDMRAITFAKLDVEKPR